MTETRPTLTAVPPIAETDSTPPLASEAPRSDEPRGFRWLPWVLGAVALICALGWISQARTTADLETRLGATRLELAEVRGELTGVRGDLEAAHGRISAYQGHLGSVRERVKGLQADFRALGQLVAKDPAPEPAP